ncbi:MAG TPA: GlsB/YeaQ/YmgE family stress response membrane protein [Chthoniobacterales bacterium]|nr:GlsB/YeaQ/YmgE family stress response membrane protein [Chthoniobacterales bacterium]
MGLLYTLLIGLVIGAVAKFLMPGRDPGGCIITILLGIAGSFLASFLGQQMGWYAAGEPAGFIFSVVGAMILLLIYRMLFGRRR